MSARCLPTEAQGVGCDIKNAGNFGYEKFSFGIDEKGYSIRR